MAAIDGNTNGRENNRRTHSAIEASDYFQWRKRKPKKATTHCVCLQLTQKEENFFLRIEDQAMVCCQFAWNPSRIAGQNTKSPSGRGSEPQPLRPLVGECIFSMIADSVLHRIRSTHFIINAQTNTKCVLA